ncbi:MAG TPA: SDR family NAD(P)-dependent oxidoreductase, partial [Clostridia bacterium]|nr:SDR family NAD(P)-dependent oxidoreductase [Clostridia bacterium]
MIDMTNWEQIASQQIHNRKQIAGRLGGKIAIVTGSAQGFGKGIAEELYREGAFVVIADLNEPLAQTVAESLGERAVAVKTDVSSEES